MKAVVAVLALLTAVQAGARAATWASPLRVLRAR